MLTVFVYVYLYVEQEIVTACKNLIDFPTPHRNFSMKWKSICNMLKFLPNICSQVTWKNFSSARECVMVGVSEIAQFLSVHVCIYKHAAYKHQSYRIMAETLKFMVKLFKAAYLSATLFEHLKLNVYVYRA
jgi:hypothetical protein